jgi:heptosyltransferase-3
MRLLFVKLKHIGDTLILTPTLTAARERYPDAQIWVVVRQGCEPILAGCPAIDRVLTSAAPETSRRKSFGWLDDLKLLREIRRQHFDYAFELSQGDRSRLFAAWSGARFRCANNSRQRIPAFWRPWFNRLSTRDWEAGHQVEVNFRLVNEFLPLGGNEPPPLAFDRARIQPCDLGMKLTDYVVIHPGTRWQRKRWPLEKWVQTGRELLKSVPQLVISVGPDAEEIQLGDALAGALGPQAVSTRGQLSWAQLAGLLYGAKLFVGVDTAAMHLAAACQCPTVAIFGPTFVAAWRPFLVRHRVITVPGVGTVLDKATRSQLETRLVNCEEVVAACHELLLALPDAR